MQDYYIFKYKKEEVVELISVYFILLLLINLILYLSEVPLLRYIIFMTPLYILTIINIIKFIKSISIEYVIKDDFIIINNKRNSSIKKLPISNIKYIKRYFTYTKSAERSYGYSKLIKVFTATEKIEIFDTIRNSYDKILPEVLEKEFGVKILHVHDFKLIIFLIITFLLEAILT